jgi:four helix bundle protein
MARERLEGLVSWRAARTLAATVHRATCRAAFQDDPDLRRDLRAAAAAVMTAIAEGYEQRTCTEFDQRLCAARSAAARLESLIYLAEDAGLLARDAATRLRARTSEIACLIEALQLAVMRYQRLQALPAPARVN